MFTDRPDLSESVKDEPDRKKIESSINKILREPSQKDIEP